LRTITESSAAAENGPPLGALSAFAAKLCRAEPSCGSELFVVDEDLSEGSLRPSARGQSQAEECGTGDHWAPMESAIGHE
jgi:hypothetical protein